MPLTVDKIELMLKRIKDIRHGVLEYNIPTFEINIVKPKNDVMHGILQNRDAIQMAIRLNYMTNDIPGGALPLNRIVASFTSTTNAVTDTQLRAQVDGIKNDMRPIALVALQKLEGTLESKTLDGVIASIIGKCFDKAIREIPLVGDVLMDVANIIDERAEQAGNGLESMRKHQNLEVALEGLQNFRSVRKSYPNIINPTTQEHIVQNEMISGLKLKNKVNINSEEGPIAENMDPEGNSTIKVIYDEICAATNISRNLVRLYCGSVPPSLFKRVKAGLIAAINAFETEHPSLRGKAKYFPPDPMADTRQALALLTTAYYMSVGYRGAAQTVAFAASTGARTEQATRAQGMIALLDRKINEICPDLSPMDLSPYEGGSGNIGKSPLNMDKRKLIGPAADPALRADLQTRRHLVRETFRAPGEGGDGIKLQTALQSAASEAEHYYLRYRNTLTEELMKSIFKAENYKYTQEIFNVYAACSIIYGTVVRAVVMQSSRDAMLKIASVSGVGAAPVAVNATRVPEVIFIPFSAVKLLADAGLVKLYSTITGHVSDSDKAKHMGAKLSNGQFTYAPDAASKATLRYYRGALKSQSNTEAAMLYLFCNTVLSSISLPLVTMGCLDWVAVKKTLHEIIAQINKTFHDPSPAPLPAPSPAGRPAAR